MAGDTEGKVAKYPGLIRRGERWWLRVVVPRPLRRALGRDQIWRTLGTSDRQEAIGRYHAARAQLQALFDQARRANYTPEALLRMVAEWVDRLDRADREEDFELYGEDLDGALAELDQGLFELRSGSDVIADAWRMLTANGWPARPHRIGPITTRLKVPIDPPDLDALTRRALIEHTLRRRDRLHRRPATTYDPAFSLQPVSISHHLTPPRRAGPRHHRDRAWRYWPAVSSLDDAEIRESFYDPRVKQGPCRHYACHDLFEKFALHKPVIQPLHQSHYSYEGSRVGYEGANIYVSKDNATIGKLVPYDDHKKPVP